MPKDNLTSEHVTNFAGDCIPACPACIKENQPKQANAGRPSNGVSYHVLVAEGAAFRLYHVNGALEIVLAEVNEDGQPASKIAGAEAVELRNWLNRVLPRQESVETSASRFTPEQLRFIRNEMNASLSCGATDPLFQSVYDRAKEMLRSPVEPTRDPYKAVCQGGAGGKCTDPDCETCWPEKASGDYCVCGKSQLARGQRGYYCKGCGKDLHPDNYETYPGEPITGIYEAGVAIVRLGKDDELGPGGD